MKFLTRPEKEELPAPDEEKKFDTQVLTTTKEDSILEGGSSEVIDVPRYDYDKRYSTESYLYYAIIDRRAEAEGFHFNWADRLLVKLSIDETPYDEKVPKDAVPKRNNAEMMVRMTSFWSVFYLITSDILGPTSAPYAFSTLGYGKGFGIYTALAICAIYCGILIWRQFLSLHSRVHPVRTFADLAFRIWGRPGKLLVMFLHAVYLLLAVSLLILSSGQSLSQVIQEKFCFVALMVFWTLLGCFVLGQIRTLKYYSRAANGSVFMTITACIISMVGVAKWAPNYSSAYSQRGSVEGPVEVVASIGGGTLDTQLVGAMNAVYAYAGSMLFPEMMAEMANPWDFWKGAFFAQGLIYIVYLFYGIFVYCYQGQFVINPAAQGVSYYPLQTVCNVLNLVSGIIAAGLYGNVGLKAMYQNIVVDIFHGPTLSTKIGKISWSGSTIIYWMLAFVVAAAVPQVSDVGSIAAAASALQFTYSFPALMSFTLQIQRDALLGDGPFDPETDKCERVDTWRDLSRWKRGFMRQWHWNTFNFILGLAALSLAGLGLWSSIISIIDTFASDGAPTSFSCQSPV